MKTIVDAYFTLLKVLIVACLVGMCVLVFGNVVLRYAFNSGITASEELSRLLFVWMTFLGAIVVLRERGHIGVDMVVLALPDAGRRACLVLSHLLMLYVTWLLLKGSWAQTQINLHVASPAVGYSMGLFYGVGLVFGLSAIGLLLHGLWQAVAGGPKGGVAAMAAARGERVERADPGHAAPRIAVADGAATPPARAAGRR